MKPVFRTKQSGQHPLPIPPVWRKILVTWLMALLTVLGVEMLSRHSFAGAFLFVGRHPLPFCLNVLLVGLCLSLSFWFPKRRSVRFLLLCLLGLLGLTNGIMLLFRVTPFCATDVTLLGSVWTVIGVYVALWQAIVILAGLAVVVVWIVMIFLRLPREKVNFRCAIGTLVIALLCTVSVSSVGHYRGVLPDHFSNLEDAYEQYGFFYCFSVGLFDRGIDRPQDYSEEAVEDILQSIGASRSSETAQKPNVVFVQLESFFDVARMQGLIYSEDPIPCYHHLQQVSSTGFLTVPSIGAGTANTEFEVLSGMSLAYFGTGEYPYKTILQNSTCETINFNLREQGYTCHAVHNYTGSFYDRNKVYANLGFDDFVSLEYMQHVTKNPIGWAKDAVLTGEVLRCLDATPGKDLVYTISVQGHGKYPTEPPEGDEPPLKVLACPEEDSFYAWQYYLNQLAETDAFIGELTRALSARQEPVILVLFGDHLPSLGIKDEDLAAGTRFQTDYLIWANYDMERRMRDLTAYQLSAYVMARIGFSNGIFTRLHQNYADSARYEEALEMLEYDVLYGEYDAYGGKQKYQPTKLQMGVTPITLTSVRVGEDIRVTGNGFTEASVILLDGRRAATAHDEDGTLRAEIPWYYSAEKLLTVQVAQIAGDGAVLSTTEERLVERTGTD